MHEIAIRTNYSGEARLPRPFENERIGGSGQIVIVHCLQSRNDAREPANQFRRQILVQQNAQWLTMAVGQPDRGGARDAVLEWRRAAAEIQALLEAAGDAFPELHSSLAASLGLVRFALEDLDRPEVVPRDACSRLLPHISDSCMGLRQVSSAIIIGTDV